MSDTDTTTDHGPIELRAATIDAVGYPDRTIDLIVAPYDEWAPVEVRGRIVEESFERGAFGAIRNRARKFLVNIDHDPTRWVGSVLDLDPDHERGLRSRIKIRRGPDGDQALNDAADGLLGASIGMAVGRSGERWESPDRRRVIKAFLDHIALTPQPTYLGAAVLEVRSTPTVVTAADLAATPNLDRVLSELRELDYLRTSS